MTLFFHVHIIPPAVSPAVLSKGFSSWSDCDQRIRGAARISPLHFPPRVLRIVPICVFGDGALFGKAYQSITIVFLMVLFYLLPKKAPEADSKIKGNFNHGVQAMR